MKTKRQQLHYLGTLACIAKRTLDKMAKMGKGKDNWTHLVSRDTVAYHLSALGESYVSQ